MSRDDEELELWKMVVGYPDYVVSNYGRVYDGVRKRMIKQWVRGGCSKYFAVHLRDESMSGGQKSKYVHRLVAEALIENVECKVDVTHMNGDKFDNRVGNLFWVVASKKRKLRAVVVIWRWDTRK